MYDDNVTYKVGINWKDIIIKFVMLILFVIILLLLFPKADLDVFYDTVYSNNVNTMKEAARNYYTVDRLPSKVGDKKSMTLKEMVDNHMLIRFTDKDGKTCDESASLVEVTKISDDEYTLKVQLKCGEQEDYILETIGCTTVCSNGTCQTVIVDKNDDNTENNGTIADNSQANNSNSNDTVDAGNGETTGDLKGNSTKVTYYQHKKPVTSTSTIYSCPAGYIKNGTKCIKTTTSATIDATPHYNPDQVITSDAKYNEGGEYKVFADYIKEQVGLDYTCPVGYTLNGVYCIKYTSATEVPGEVKYTCPTDYTLNGTKCEKVYKATYVSGETTYSCPNGGTLNGTKCTITTNASSSTEYTCPAGYTRDGSKCTLTYNATQNPTYGYYTCPNGGTLSGTNCVLTRAADKIVGDTTYTCPSGYTYNKDLKKCEMKISATITPEYEYTCPAGYTKTGEGADTQCYKVMKGEGNYYCEDANATLSGTKCVTTIKGGIDHYTCPTDYTLDGTKCSKTTTVTVDAEKEIKTSTSYKYKWSKSSKLDGWEFTGKTKVVEESYKAAQK